MKKLFTLLIVFAFIIGAFSQAPEKMSYQAVIRNSNGELVKNSNIGMQISILQGSETGTAVYVETHASLTNVNGLVTIEIGGGTPVTGTFAGIDWSTGVYFLKTETDLLGGTNYSITGTSQLLSVPFALYAKKTENIDLLMQRVRDMEDLVASQLDPPSDGLIAYYPFNGDARDESWNGCDGTVVDAIPAADRIGEQGYAYSFDGNSGTERYIYANIGKHSTLSVSVWFKSGTPTTMYPNVFNYGSTNRLDATILGNHSSYITQNTMGQFGAGSVVGGGFTSYLNSTRKYIDDKWHHAVVMFVANDNMYLYIDNILIGETPYTPNNPSDDLFYIGRQINDNAGSVLHETHFNGSIDDIRIYDRKLTPAEISVLFYEDGYPKTLITDIDGNSYNTVEIGTQTWMSENLKTTKYSNGEAIPNVTNNTSWAGLTSGAYCWYNNDASAYKNSFGALYNFYAVTDSRNICPTGWHVPSDAEWTTLTDYLTNNGYGYEDSGSDIAKSMAAKSGWATDATAGNVGNDQASNNSSGFSALPSGHRQFTGNAFAGAGVYVDWWSSTANYYRSMHTAGNSVTRNAYPERSGFAVRCLKD